MTISSGSLITSDDILGSQRTTVEAGETISLGNVCYINKTDGKAYISTTATANKIRADGIAIAGVSSGADVTLITRGKWVTSGLTDKEDYYLGAAGAISTTRSGVKIGVADGTTALYINIIQDDQAIIGSIKPYVKSFTGIPSNNMTAFWVECDGSVLSDSESPLNGQTLPNLNGLNQFIRGNSTSGGTGTLSDSNTDLAFYDVVFLIKVK